MSVVTMENPLAVGRIIHVEFRSMVCNIWIIMKRTCIGLLMLFI